MANRTLIAPTSWQWQSGVTRNTLQFLPDTGELLGAFTWVEESAPAGDASGHGSHVEFTQSLAGFLEQGPSQSTPVDIVEAILAHVQVESPVWLEAYRLPHPVSVQIDTTGKAVLEKCADACARTGWSFLGELICGGIIEGAALLLEG